MPDRPPLVLTVYPPIPPRPSSVAVNAAERRARTAWWSARQREDDLGAQKRLTDAELAAEYWKANSEGWCNDALHGSTWDPYTGKPSNPDVIKARLDVLERFATHPHYDERRTDA